MKTIANDIWESEDLQPITVTILQDHVKSLKNENKATPHDLIFHKLIEQIEPLDFYKLAFPEIDKLRTEFNELEQILIKPDRSFNTDKELHKERERSKAILKKINCLVLSNKHYLILSIENIIKIAEQNRWGLCKNHSFIYLYNGTYWAEIDKEAFEKFLGEATEKMGVAKFDARYYKFRDELFKQFLKLAYLPTPPIQRDKVLINLKNGTFEITQQNTKLRPFDRSDFITYQLQFEYDPQAKAPLFEDYLNRVLPDKERQRVLAEYLGYVFIKHGSNTLKEEKALILYGTGANGKSVFFDIVTALLGRENVSNYSLQNLTEEKGFYRAKINNKLVNYASEINGKLEASLFKAMVTGEPVEACLKYGQPFTMEQYAKFIFNCNELPKDVEHTNAYFRRFLIIPFDVTIPEHEQDKQLSYKIIESELSGVFNWVLQGLNRLLEQKRFSNCEAVNKAIEQYKTESNSVQLFINDNEYKACPLNYISIKELYPEYRSFCFEDGIKPFKKNNFIKQLRELGHNVTNGSQNKLVVYIDKNTDF
jgi:putative DNA primase/helicase